MMVKRLLKSWATPPGEVPDCVHFFGTAAAPDGFRENRSQIQDGRKLRRYKRRWCVERLYAWLQWFRRLVTRYEYHIENVSAWSALAA
jgi:transposase